MTNIITELEQRNKQLLKEIEELKLKIWHVTGQSLDKDGEVGMYAPKGTWWYKNLNQKWLDEGKLRMAVDPNETREWAKNCKRVYLDNITIQEMLDDFIDSSNELSSEWLNHVRRLSNANSKLYEQKKEYEKKIKELEKELEEKELIIENLNAELEAAEAGREANLDAIKLAEIWEARKSLAKIEALKKEIDNKQTLLQECFDEWIKQDRKLRTSKKMIGRKSAKFERKSRRGIKGRWENKDSRRIISC